MELLTLESLKTAARNFCSELSVTQIHNLYGVTDGKAVGTYVESTFNQYLSSRYEYTLGSAALGIDFPGLEVDLKVTSIKQPQSSCPFRNASQKVYGLGYNLLIFAYEKIDDHSSLTANLKCQNVVFVAKEQTGDYQTTYGIIEIIRRNGNKDDIVAFLEERNFPLDEIGREALAVKILQSPPEIGYLTISNALQWRLQYSRVIQVSTIGITTGIEKFPEHIEFLNSKKDNDKSESEIIEISETTPQESIEFGYQKIRKELELELLNRVKSCSPDFFERLVVDLLVKMGYGGSRRDAGKAIGKSGDGGIDGIIKEDKLGLDIVYIQAKRWDNTVVGRPEIQKFVGALHGQRARKGVFITTSRFSQEAREYVSIIDNKIVLIDGQELAQLMIDNHVGVSTVSIYEIKKIDSDYFTDE